MTIFAPELKIPSCNTIKSRIEKVYCNKKEKLITELDQIEYVSLTTDTWTSNSTNVHGIWLYYIIKLTQVLVIDLLPMYDRKSFDTTV